MNATAEHEALAASAWQRSDKSGDVVGEINSLAEERNLPPADVSEAILLGLMSLSDVVVRTRYETDIAAFGRCEFDGEPCYWWRSQAGTFWSNERPSWWSDQVRRMTDQA